jgi:hypothetical protein
MSKSKLIAFITILTIMLVAIPVFTGCGKVAEYADPITENILTAMNNGDYASFAKDFDETMKKELSEAAFPDFLAAVNGSIGNYILGSKKITGVNIENNLTTATYNADFEQMEGVTVTVVFEKIDNKMTVVGLWFE